MRLAFVALVLCALAAAAAAQDFLPVVLRPEPKTVDTPCLPTASAPKNAKANITRAWFAQNHLMETTWPFFTLVADRGGLMKLDVTDPAGGVAPQIRVDATWTGGKDSRCMAPPNSKKLPKSVDMRPQPDVHVLTNSYRMTLPSAWMKPGLTLKVAVSGVSTVKTFPPAQLKMVKPIRPKLQVAFADALLFGDTEVRTGNEGSDGVRAEYAARFPFSEVAFFKFPVPIVLPKIVIDGRGDGKTPTGQPASHPPVVATRKPSCTDAEKAAAKCTVYSGFGVLSFTISLSGVLREINGISGAGLWYNGHGKNSGLGGGLGGGLSSSGDDFALIMNHENGHALDLPHWGGVTGDRQKNAKDKMYPYFGETADGSSYVGGGFGKTTAYDPISGALSSWKCKGVGAETQDPMQRGCNNIAPGFRLDHFSDYSIMFLQRMWTGQDSKVKEGTVPYYSRYLRGSSATKWGAVPFRFSGYGARIQAEWTNGSATPTYTRLNPDTLLYQTVLRPPGDDNFVKDVPKGPASVYYNKYFDFNFPLQYNVPVITVFGSFDYNKTETSQILGVYNVKGHYKRLFDPSDPTTFALIKKSISGDTFWWGWNLHLRVKYASGKTVHVAIRRDVQKEGKTFTFWGVNLLDNAGPIEEMTLLFRLMCVRYGGMKADCNLNSNPDVTAANFYSTAEPHATWRPT